MLNLTTTFDSTLETLMIVFSKGFIVFVFDFVFYNILILINLADEINFISPFKVLYFIINFESIKLIELRHFRI